MLATAVAEMGHASPKDLPGRHAGLLCYVDDVDAHFKRARGAGATILSQPKDPFYVDRMYGASDPEGHHGYFATHVKDVSPADTSSPEA